jgi:hypothetical protein
MSEEALRNTLARLREENPEVVRELLEVLERPKYSQQIVLKFNQHRLAYAEFSHTARGRTK